MSQQQAAPTPSTNYIKPDRDLILEELHRNVIPGNLHFNLRHSELPEVDLNKWRLTVQGLVANPMELTIDDIKARPSVTATVAMECVGNGRQPKEGPRRLGMIGNAEWTGTPLLGLLQEADFKSEAVEVLFTAFDIRFRNDRFQPYHSSLPIEEALRKEILLAYEMNGKPLPLDYGFPLRLIVPGWYGMVSVRWLESIQAIGEPFLDDAKYGGWGVPDTFQSARALMIPPGITDPQTYTQSIGEGRIMLIGKAWGGRFGLERVEVSCDGGSTWSEARLQETDQSYGWQEWSFPWEAVRGRHTLYVRATDTQGNSQPQSSGGGGKTAAQSVDVLVK